ncbi:electron transport complex subunit RsxE [Sporanaerobium hydrogeniformans]|uniref:Electron transport complex subunit RsxE n=1 Tax=Sporanaerobium hydrogeniformans TaxID=3072179 RepID=A0AC61DE80_9FIRM|nr:electron transport complex subunit E [Sporanaerobium hydrogeniformans]PHV71476.1 electron transport complex subunit RsxE [Sporanaerobium hydrogeniformans]
MKALQERLKAGIVLDNPTFVQVLGMCPTLAVTTSAENAVGMGLATTAVLICSNLVISLLRKCIPNKIRIPAFIVIIASFVTIIDLILQAYITSLHAALGLFIPLIVVNCIILGRAEAFAFKNKPLPSMFDGLGMGLGFTTSLTVIGMIREILGAGQLFGNNVMPESYTPAIIMILAPGAFFTLGILMAILNTLKAKKH